MRLTVTKTLSYKFSLSVIGIFLGVLMVCSNTKASARESQAFFKNPSNSHIVYFITGGVRSEIHPYVAEALQELKKAIAPFSEPIDFRILHNSKSSDICKSLSLEMTARDLRQRNETSRPIASLSSEKPLSPKLIMIGHSFGASAIMQVARCLEKKGIAIDGTITLDPIQRPFDGSASVVPANVFRDINYFQTADSFLKGIQRLTRDDNSELRISSARVIFGEDSNPHNRMVAELARKGQLQSDLLNLLSTNY